ALAAQPGARAPAVRARRPRFPALGIQLLVVAVLAAADRPLRGHLRGRALLRRRLLRRLPRARQHALALAAPPRVRAGDGRPSGADLARGAHRSPERHGAGRRGRDADLLLVLLRRGAAPAGPPRGGRADPRGPGRLRLSTRAAPARRSRPPCGPDRG